MKLNKLVRFYKMCVPERVPLLLVSISKSELVYINLYNNFNKKKAANSLKIMNHDVLSDRSSLSVLDPQSDC